jgi:hypothetical protein
VWGGVAAAGEFAAEFEVFAVGLFECVAQGLDLGAVSFLQLGDLQAECLDEGVLRIGWGRVGSG